MLGREKCGAVAATIAAVEQGAVANDKIQTLVDRLRPAVEQVQGQPGDFCDNAIRTNIELTVKTLKENPLLQGFIEQDKLAVVGAYYELETGKVVLSEAA